MIRNKVRQLTKEEKYFVKGQIREWGMAFTVCNKKQEEIRQLNRLIERGKKEDSGVDAHVIDEYLEEISHITESIHQILQKKKYIGFCIDCLPLEEQEFLHLRFEKEYEFEAVALRMHMSRSNCFRLQDKTFLHLLERFEAEERAVAK